MIATLERELLDAHERGDKPTLSRLYTAAADSAEDDDAERFFLVHAYVFALDCGLDTAPELKTRLVALGSEPEG